MPSAQSAASIKRVIGMMGGVTGARLAGAALAFIVQLALARALAPADFGHVMTGISVAGFAALAVSAGYGSLGTTALARYQALGRPELLSGFFAVALRDAAWVAAAGLAAVSVFLWFAPVESATKAAVVFGAAAALPFALMRLSNSAADSLRRFSLSVVPDFIYRPMLFLIAVGALIATGGAPQPAAVLALFLVVSTAVAIWQVRALGASGPLSGFGKPAPRRLARALRPRALPLAFVAVIVLAHGDMITAVAAVFLPPGDVAVAGIAIRLAAIAGFVVQALQHLVLRDITSAIVRRDDAGEAAILWRTNLLTSGLMAAAVGVAALGGGWALSIFGSSYAEGKWLLVLFAGCHLLRAAGGMNFHMLSLGGFQARLAIHAGVTVACLVSAAALLVPHYGPLGFAIAVFLAECYWIGALGVLARILLGQGADLVAVSDRWGLSRAAP